MLEGVDAGLETVRMRGQLRIERLERGLVSGRGACGRKGGEREPSQ
jgi:hypothetical protein